MSASSKTNNISITNHFLSFLISNSKHSTFRQRIVPTILNFARQEDGYTLGHRKKNVFLEKVLHILFDFNNLLNE